ncbi:hypothetical protein [Azospirillum aestuarii]|uniref:hypothetical protein n=1 Tax=Azospirillum aestuarii TaxID=2802052 RepID=UPI0040550BEC
MSSYKIRSIHPFPARMAPDLALVSLGSIPAGSRVLDPMSGSGTVIRQALEMGHSAVGVDLDPLAILMSKVWTTEVRDEDIVAEFKRLKQRLSDMGDEAPVLPWQQDAETTRFVNYWFHDAQRRDLTRIAAALNDRSCEPLTIAEAAALDALRVAFSRIIITKEQGASLARDTSHSRPHRVATESKYAVLPNFERSVVQLRKRLSDNPPPSTARVVRGDARALDLENASIDAVITSPPYLNAIDYMRGHRMSLVWLGYSIPELRIVRSNSIGAERNADKHDRQQDAAAIAAAIRGMEPLTGRIEGIIGRYSYDLLGMTAEVSRVLRSGGQATFIVGNSCIKGTFVNNANGVAEGVRLAGMVVTQIQERELPVASRYLPVTGDSLSKRMRTETILKCRKP